MDVSKIELIYGILNTIWEALDHTKCAPNDEMTNDIRAGRESVTQFLEQEMGVSLEEQINISAISDNDWMFTVKNILKELISPFKPQNIHDAIFKKMINDIWKNSEEELLEVMKENYTKARAISENDCKGFVDYLNKYRFWGSFDPDNGDWTAFRLRAEVLKRHSYDFLWLYRRLEDYTSRSTLVAILVNWKDFSLYEAYSMKSKYSDYFDPDIIPNNFGEVFVDVGAFVGDTIEKYIQNYGGGYKKIYAYEISHDSCEEIRKAVEKGKWHDVIVCEKGVGAERGEMFLSKHDKDASSNRVGDQGENRIEIVRIDEDAPDATFIKMDIEGAEQSAIEGCRDIIRKKHPKLAICVYHGYEDLWKIPSMINDLYPDYHFYMRHYGWNLPPTEFVLYCKE